MKTTKAIAAGIVVLLITFSFTAQASAERMGVSAQVEKLKVTSPPQQKVNNLNLDPFYKKHIDVDGFSIVSSEKVNDYALKEAAYLIKRVTKNRPDILEKLVENKVRFVIMACDELTTQMPEHSDLKPSKFWDKRARGLGATPQRTAVSCGEENLLCFPGDPYHQENILIHEFAHAIHHMAINFIDPEFDKKLKAAYDDAMTKGLWKDKYAATNRAEYWAEAVQSYFDDNRQPDHDHNHVNTRKELIEYDHALAKLVKEQLGPIQWKYKKPTDRNKRNSKHLTGYDGSNKPTFAWPEELLKWYDNYEREQKKSKHKSPTRPKTPIMGWSSWNNYRININEELIRINETVSGTLFPQILTTLSLHA